MSRLSSAELASSTAFSHDPDSGFDMKPVQLHPALAATAIAVALTLGGFEAWRPVMI